MIHGDYDVDGVSATALLLVGLRHRGAAADFYIPHRIEEGYGLHSRTVRALARRGVQLLVTVDCGTTARAALEEAARLGLDCVVTDHHLPPPAAQLPPAYALVNPGLTPGAPPLSGAGVAWKVLDALAPEVARSPAGLALAALGTVADVVPLVGENRILAREGLAALPASGLPGLSALLELTGLAGRPVRAGHVGFVLGPRLNAAGRLAHGTLAVRLLTTSTPGEAQAVAAQLEAANEARRQIQERIWTEARERVAAWERVPPAIVLGDPAWHPGVIGIVASRLAETFHRPVALMAVEGARARGSARSVPGFHLHQALSRLAELFDTFGGHEMAAGFTLAAGQMARFAEAFTRLAGEALPAGAAEPALLLDAWVEPAELELGAVQELEQLAPFGPGNPAPVVGLRDAELVRTQVAGASGEHLRLLVAREERLFTAIGFGMVAAGVLPELAPGQRVDLAFTPEVDHWNGQARVRLVLKGLRPASRERVRLPAGRPAGDGLDDALREVYRALRAALGGAGPGRYRRWPGTAVLYRELRRHRPVPLGPAGIEAALEIFAELGLVEVSRRPGELRVALRQPPAGKLDLRSSQRYNELMLGASSVREEWGSGDA